MMEWNCFGCKVTYGQPNNILLLFPNFGFTNYKREAFSLDQLSVCLCVCVCVQVCVCKCAHVCVPGETHTKLITTSSLETL